MPTDDAKRLAKEIRELERRHEVLTRRYNRAFMRGLPGEGTIQQELQVSATLILTREAELRALRGADAETPGPPPKGSWFFTWVLSRRR